ncbi:MULTISPECIES: prepilin-type N-terminal cleavage/methylation domain-containing protein [unclassified Thioalkalivibrio]|uniref:type IV pilus modification PilV family protein n=1 Tax=unclassified Thioalkalivibrio TaxID=2621013 RepID=UPI001E64B22D|nr:MULTISPECIES: prepilin-type N-terminal cleavage/methylation domain-containing protein [unclassified Thioalkalivibrio]
MASYSKQQGFSLLEVLVAFVVMALTLGVLFQVFGSGLRTTTAGDEYAQASTLAQGRLALAADTPPLEAGSRSGQFEGTEFRWEQEIRTLQMDLPRPEGVAAYHVSVRVWWPSGRGERELVLDTIRLQQTP